MNDEEVCLAFLGEGGFLSILLLRMIPHYVLLFFSFSLLYVLHDGRYIYECTAFLFNNMDHRLDIMNHTEYEGSSHGLAVDRPDICMCSLVRNL